MLIFDYYLILCTHFSRYNIREEIPITLEQLSSIWFCSIRNIYHVIKKMEELHWVTWVSGRGRGNFSKLTLLVEKDDLALHIAQEMVRKDDIKGAFSLVEKISSELLREQFLAWLINELDLQLKNRNSSVQKSIHSLIVTMDSSILSLDPAFLTVSSEKHLIQHIFDPLVKYNDQTQGIEAHIAHFWETDQTKTTWRLYLRRGVYFHHKRELTAYDVKYTLERLRNDKGHKTPYHLLYQSIKAVRVQEDSCIDIQLKGPNQLFLHLLSRSQASIVPQDIYRPKDEKEKRFDPDPVGTGPFMFSKQGETIVLKAFPSYFKGRPLIDSVEIWNLPDLSNKSLAKQRNCFIVQYTDLREEEVDGMRRPQQKSSCWKRKKTGPWYKLLTFNMGKEGPQKNVLFRKALVQGIDRRRMAEEAGGATSSPITGIFSTPTAHEDVGHYDPEKARKMLNELGYQGETLQLLTYDLLKKEAYWLQDHCKQIGIDLDVTVVTLTEMLHSKRMNEAHILLSGRVMVDHTEVSLLEFFLAENSFLRMQMTDLAATAIDSHVAEIYQQENQAKRLKAIKTIEEQLRENESVTFLCQCSHDVYYHASLDGVTLDSTGWVQYQDVWVRPEENPGIPGFAEK